MKRRQWLENWGMTKLKIKTPFLEGEWEPQDFDRDAAWELYVELLTRITTQPLPADIGDEQTALDSIYVLFGITREILRSRGRFCNEFAKIAIIVLNQIVRPFTAKWHGLSLKNAFSDPENCIRFREELAEIQGDLRTFSRMLADMAQVEDLTILEDM